MLSNPPTPNVLGQNNWWTRLALLITALVALGIVVFACGSRNQAAQSVFTPGSNTEGVSKQTLQPGANPGKEATLLMAGLKIPVDLEHGASDGRITLALRSYGQVVEEENYLDSAETFSMVAVAGENYQPPLPLLKFPVPIGESWNWTGQMSTGGASRNATATINTIPDHVEIGGQQVEAVRVNVGLAMDSGGPQPAQRRLAFWFVPSKGLVKREFGVGSTRVPGHVESEAQAKN